MSVNSQNVSARRAKAISLIQAGLIHSQTDLVDQLKKSGFRVTQTTASRDLEEIGAVRGRNAHGESVYQIRESSVSKKATGGAGLAKELIAFANAKNSRIHKAGRK